MGGGDLNMNKSWRPQTMHNMERIWKVEERSKREKEQIEQLLKEKAEERMRDCIKPPSTLASKRRVQNWTGYTRAHCTTRKTICWASPSTAPPSARTRSPTRAPSRCSRPSKARTNPLPPLPLPPWHCQGKGPPPRRRSPSPARRQRSGSRSPPRHRSRSLPAAGQGLAPPPSPTAALALAPPPVTDPAAPRHAAAHPLPRVVAHALLPIAAARPRPAAAPGYHPAMPGHHPRLPPPLAMPLLLLQR